MPPGVGWTGWLPRTSTESLQERRWTGWLPRTSTGIRWQQFMEPYFEIPPGSRPDQMMVELEEVFHTD